MEEQRVKLINEARLQENIQCRMDKDLAEGNIIGAAARVYQKDKLVFDGRFGVTKIGTDKEVQVDTLYRLASMTKPVTAVAVMILADRGLIQLEDLVEQYLPEFAGIQIVTCDESGNITRVGLPEKKISIFHLLTHSSGLGSLKVGTLFMKDMTKEDRATLESAVHYYGKTGIAFEPFTLGAYSGVAGFDVLARIVEVVTGQNFQQFIQENICIPLDMKDTTFAPTKEQWDRMIQLHNKKNGKMCEGDTVEGCVFGDYPTTHYLGGAGLASTIHDYSNFAQMLLHNGSFRGKQIISAESVRQMATPYIYMDCPPYNQKWGLGVRVITGEDYQRLPVGAYGWSGAYGTHFWVDPVNQIAAIYMKNSIYDGGSGAKSARHMEEDVNASLEEA